MSKLNLMNDILNDSFRETKGFLEEKSVMTIDLDKRGCKTVLIYRFDKQLGKEYKGGLFPFFAKRPKVCIICDYIIFVEKQSKLYALVVELKEGRGSNAMSQLKAAECFVNYAIATMNRINHTNIDIEIKKINIREFQPKKRNTKMKTVIYDNDNYCIYPYSHLCLAACC